MEKLKNFIKTYQVQIVLVIGYILVAGLGFGLGRFSVHQIVAPEIKVEQAANPPVNYTPNVAAIQTQVAVQTTAATISAQNCAGKIKGSSSKIYHLPGGAFYDKTTHPVACFDTEAQARAAGFRKSAR
jgi:hypothetical protein